jgi:PAS domain S-box-containing protein
MESKTEQMGLILLIMYDRLQVSVFTEKLRGYGYNDIEVCYDAKAALEKLSIDKPAVVICDIELKSEINGIETGKKIRDQYDLPLIYMSRLHDEKTFQKALDTHPHAFLSKPVNWNELRIAIESAKFNNQKKASIQTDTDVFVQRIEKAHVPYHILDKDGILTGVNKAWTELTGYTADEVRGKWFGDFLYKNFQEKFTQDFMTIIKKSVSHDLEYDFLGKGKQIIAISLTCITNTDRHGDFVSMYCITNNITEKKRLQNKLRESEERFRTLFEEAPLGYQSLAENGGIIYVNHTWCRMFGYDKKEVIGKWFGDFLSSEDQEKFRRNFEILKQTGVKYSVKYEMIKKDRTKIHVSIDGKVRYDEQGNYIQSHCILKDITEQKLAEDALLESEKKFRKRENEIRTITDNIPALISYVDANGYYRFINRQYEKWFGISSEEIIGKHYKEVLGEVAYEQIKDHVDKALSGRQLTFDSELSYPHGGTRWITAEYIPDFDDKGKVSGFFALVTDITEHIQAEKELRASEERYRGLADSITDIFFAMDKDLKYTFWNKASEKLTGILEKQAIGKHLLEIFPDTTQVRKAENVYRSVLKNSKATNFINDFTLDDKDFVFEINAYPAGEGISVFVKDITEKKKIESELYESKQMLQIVLDTIPDGVFWKDSDLFYRGCNRTFLNANGLNYPEEVVGKTDYDFPWGKEVADSFREQDKKIMESGIPEFNIIESVTMTDGTHSWARTNKVPMRDMKGNIIGILGTYEDITESKQAEEAVRMERQRLHDVLEVMPMMVCLLTPDYHIKFANRAFREKFGESHGRHCYEYCFDNNEPCDFCQSYRVLKTGKPHKWQVINLKGDAIVDVYNFPFTDADGSNLILEVDVDITEQKKAEQALQTSQSRLANAMDIARLGYWEYDVEEDIFTFDDHFYSIFNTSAEKVGGYKMSSARYAELFVHPEDRHQVGSEIRKVLETTDPNYTRQLEHRMIYADGSTGYISVRFFIIKDDQGRTIRTYGANQDITEHKEAEKRLQESEERYRQVFENYPVGIVLTDPGKKFISANPSFCKMLGYSEEELKSMTFLDVTHPEHQDTDKEKIIELWQGKIPEYRTEKRYITRNGNVIWGNLISTLIRDQDDKPLRALAMIQDITDRKKAETELLTSEARFKAFMDNLPVMTYIKDKKGKYIYGNKANLKLAGITLNQFRDTEVSDYLPANLAKRMKQMDKKVMITGKAIELDEWKYVKGNIERWFTEYKFPITASDEEQLIGGWMMDITRRKAVESALKESEKIYKDLVEKAGIAIMTDDVNGNITYSNREFARLFDYTISGIKKQSRETLIHREDLQRMISYHTKRIKGEKAPDHYEVRGIRKNGDNIWIEVKTTVLEEKNKITGTRNYMWDITERKKFQEAIKNSEARFRELFSNMSNGVAIYKYIPESDEFVFRDMNMAGMRVCRISKKEEIAGRSIIDCFPGAETMGLVDMMKKVWKTGRPEKVEDIYYKDDRLELYVENRVYKLPTGEIVSVFDDITERMEAELELKESYKQIKKLSRHVEAIREEERKQIARNLHDDLGQMLTAIKMDVSWIRNKIPEQERKGIKKRIKSTIDITDKAIRSVSRLSSELRPGVLDDLGLMEALKEYLRDYEKRIGIKIRTNLPEKEPKLKPDQDISVYRIIQEALTNVARHSNATEADLTMKEKNSNLEIRIHDNGTGISKDKVQSPESFGILSMKERVLGWGGSFEIRGARNRGTTINIIMPVL